MNTAFLGVFAGITSHALAQPFGEAKWLWTVDTDNGDSIVEVGESATISLSIEMTIVTPGHTVDGLSYIEFDTVGGPNAFKGTINSWELHRPLDTVYGDQTTTDGVSLFGTIAAQGFRNWSYDNPIDVLTFNWQPSQYAEYEVRYDTLSTSLFDVPHWIGVFIDEMSMYQEWPIEEAAVTFLVVPSPSGLMIVLAGIAVLAPRVRH